MRPLRGRRHYLDWPPGRARQGRRRSGPQRRVGAGGGSRACREMSGVAQRWQNIEEALPLLHGDGGEGGRQGTRGFVLSRLVSTADGHNSAPPRRRFPPRHRRPRPTSPMFPASLGVVGHARLAAVPCLCVVVRTPPRRRRPRPASPSSAQPRRGPAARGSDSPLRAHLPCGFDLGR